MHESGSFLPSFLLFLGAAVLAVPIAKRVGLGAVLGYLLAGIAIGPSGFRLFTDTGTIAEVAELGVVLLLFVIGLELQLPRLLAMRRDIFGLGALQLVVCALVIGLIARLTGLDWRGATVTGIALALSATAIALGMLNERGDLQERYGQRSFAVLLFQDVAVVPILAVVPLLGDSAAAHPVGLVDVGLMAATLAAVVLVGRYGLNPFFRILAKTGAHEVMTAAALLLVLGTALLMQRVGMSMALGAFLAGVMLAESKFRHELEADIEPFRGLLLGLFFMSVGMGLDGPLVLRHFVLLIAGTIGLSLGKSALIACLLRLTGSPLRDAVRAGFVLAPAGEFAFVLLPLAMGAHLLPGEAGGLLLAVAALTMLVGSPLASLADRLLQRAMPAAAEPDEDYSDARGVVLLIGFGRFGQIIAQLLRTAAVPVTIIDRDVEMIDVAARFGSKVYYGDGARLDVLRAAGAGEAQVICIAVDDREAAVRIVELAKAEFPLARVFSRAYDRQHALALMSAGVDELTRETFESAMVHGRLTMEAVGISAGLADEILEDVRDRDLARMAAQAEGGIYAGLNLVKSTRILRPEPLDRPKRAAVSMNPEAIRAAETAQRKVGATPG